MHLNGNRRVEGVLRGYDQFMNMVLDECEEIQFSSGSGGGGGGEEVSRRRMGKSMIRGNSIVSMEVLDRM